MRLMTTIVFCLFLVFGFSPALGQASPTPTPSTTPPAEALEPFLTLPFNKARIKRGSNYTVSEGYFYSAEEQAIHGGIKHYAVDIDADDGEPLYAPCDGWYQQGFHTAIAMKGTGPVLYKGSYVGYGLGRFIQFACKKTEQKGKPPVLNVMAHMREVSPKIPSVKVVNDGKTFPSYNPEGIYVQTPERKGAKYLKKGTFVGRVGCSGLGLGEFEDPYHDVQRCWDSRHVHIEVFRRTAAGGKDPAFRWDPFGWYKSVADAPYKEFRQSPLGLFITDKDGKLKFACNDDCR